MHAKPPPPCSSHICSQSWQGPPVICFQDHSSVSHPHSSAARTRSLSHLTFHSIMADSGTTPTSSSSTAIADSSSVAVAGPSTPSPPPAEEGNSQQGGSQTPSVTSQASDGSSTTRPAQGPGSRGGRTTARGGRTPVTDPEPLPEPPSGTPTMRVLMFVKDTPNQPNNANNLILSEDFVAADCRMLLEQLYIRASNLTNREHRPKPCGLPTRVFGQPPEWVIGNQDPSEEDTMSAHQYFTIHKKAG